MNEQPRRIYETIDDLGQEKAIAEKLEVRWHCVMRKLPRSYRLDWAASDDGKIRAWLEFKRRYRTFDQYPDTFLALGKVMAAREFVAATSMKCLFVVQFDDALAYADMVINGREIVFGGRTDRDDWEDIEPVVLVPMADFTKIVIPAPPLEHVCEVCGDLANFGYGVNLRADKLGEWYCDKHRPDRKVAGQ